MREKNLYLSILVFGKLNISHQVFIVQSRYECLFYMQVGRVNLLWWPIVFCIQYSQTIDQFINSNYTANMKKYCICTNFKSFYEIMMGESRNQCRFHYDLFRSCEVSHGSMESRVKRRGTGLKQNLPYQSTDQDQIK